MPLSLHPNAVQQRRASKLAALTAGQPVPAVTPVPPNTTPGHPIGGVGVPGEIPTTGPTLPGSPSPPTGGAVQPPPSTTPTTPPATTPPATTPPATTPPATTPPGQTQTVDYSADPILQKIRALSQQQIADAQSAATAQKKSGLIEFGYQPNAGLDALFPDDTTKQAAQGNPFSTLAQLAYGHQQTSHNLDESLNNGGLFYSGERVRQLAGEGRNYNLAQSQANSGLSRLMSQIDANLLAAQRGAQGQEIAGEESAYERALNFALQNGGGTTPPGTTTPGGWTVPPGGGPPFVAPGQPPGTPITPGPMIPTVVPGATGAQTQAVPGSNTTATTPGWGTSSSSGIATAPVTSLSGFQALTGAWPTSRSTAGSAVGSQGTLPAGVPSAQQGQPNWQLVRNSSSLPGNHAPSGTAGGTMYNADDPYMAANVQAAHAAGEQAGVWIVPHPGETGAELGARAGALSQQLGVPVMIDSELQSKGYPGSPQYQYTADFMASYQQAGGGPGVSVTVQGGGEDDYNYKAVTDAGGMIWIQTYGADPAKDQFDPTDAYNKMIARGVPASQIGLMLAPGQVGPPGVPTALYTIDDQAPQAQPLSYSKQTSGATSKGLATAISNATSSGNYSPQTVQAITQLVTQAYNTPQPLPLLTQSRSKPSAY